MRTWLPIFFYSKTLMKIERDFFFISHFTPVHYTNFVHWIVWDDLGSCSHWQEAPSLCALSLETRDFGGAEGGEEQSPLRGKKRAVLLAPLQTALSTLHFGTGWGWRGRRREEFERPHPEGKISPVFRGSAPDLKGVAGSSCFWHNGLYAERRGQGGGGAE